MSIYIYMYIYIYVYIDRYAAGQGVDSQTSPNRSSKAPPPNISFGDSIPILGLELRYWILCFTIRSRVPGFGVRGWALGSGLRAVGFRMLLVSGFMLVVSGFWFLVSGF